MWTGAVRKLKFGRRTLDHRRDTSAPHDEMDLHEVAHSTANENVDETSLDKQQCAHGQSGAAEAVEHRLRVSRRQLSLLPKSMGARCSRIRRRAGRIHFFRRIAGNAPRAPVLEARSRRAVAASKSMVRRRRNADQPCCRARHWLNCRSRRSEFTRLHPSVVCPLGHRIYFDCSRHYVRRKAFAEANLEAR
jgi:hypothetical protein